VVIDKVVAKILDRCFPEILDLPSGSAVFSSIERDKNFDFLVEVAYQLAGEEIDDDDFSKLFSRKVTTCIPVGHRSDFITWICTKYLSDPRIYAYLYGTSDPLAKTDRKLSDSDLKTLIPIINSLDE
jgi:hypothetical protein